MWEHIMAMLPGRAEPPCLSLYQPTHRHHPDNLQDPIRFRNRMGSWRLSGWCRWVGW